MPISLGKVYRELCINYAKKEYPSYRKMLISDEASDSDIRIDTKKGKYIYENNVNVRVIAHEIAEFTDVFLRERYFRTQLDFVSSKKEILYTYSFFIDLFKSNSYQKIITLPVDNYIVDVMSRVAKFYNIEVIGIQRFYKKNLVRQTIRGEYQKNREVSEKEINDFISEFHDSNNNIFAPNKKKVYFELFKYFFVYNLKLILHYFLRYKVLNNLKYKYISTKTQVYPKNIIKNLSIYNKFLKNNFIFLDGLESKKTVYIPLHYYPEATVEYWVYDNKYSDYYTYLINVIDILTQNNYRVFIKEHPAIYLKRDMSNLIPILNNNDVFIFSPFVDTKEVFKYSDSVVVWTGTTGVESIMSGIPTYFIEENFYSKGVYMHWHGLISNILPIKQNPKIAVKNVLETTKFIN